MAKDVKQLIKEAAEAVKGLPENLQQAAFNKAFEHLADEQNHTSDTPSKSGRNTGSRHTTPRSTSKAKPQAKAHYDEDSIHEKLDQLDRTSYQMIADDRSPLENALRVLHAAHEDLGIDGLTGTDIARVLNDKFRCKAYQPSIARALNNAGKYVNRYKEGQKVIFKIMAAGETYLNDLDAGVETKPKRKSSTKSKSTPSKTNPSKASAKKTKAPAKKTKSNRPGPKAILMQLHENNFFKKPQTIALIIEHVKHNRGHMYKQTDFSPALVRLVRDGVLVRNQNSDNQYEYSNA